MNCIQGNVRSTASFHSWISCHSKNAATLIKLLTVMRKSSHSHNIETNEPKYCASSLNYLKRDYEKFLVKLERFIYLTNQSINFLHFPLKSFFFLIFWNKTGRLVVWRSCTKPAAMCYSEKGQNAFQTITRALSHLRPIREQMGWKIALYLHCALIWPNLKTNLQRIVLDSHRILLKSKQYHISGVFVASGISMRAPYLFSLPWYAFITAWI